MRPPRYLQNVLVGASALVFAGAHFMPGRQDQSGPVLTAAVKFVSPKTSPAVEPEANGTLAAVQSAVVALGASVTRLSNSKALDAAFGSYYAYKATHAGEVRKPYLYFVDYGLPSTEPRGYVFDMESLQVVDGPFTVAHGRGSSTTQYGVPTHFSNAANSYATSLGLYVAQSTYDFHGHAGGAAYSSIGLRLQGVSSGFNDNAAARRVVAHGAPYVTSSRAGRSEGCPAMEPARAERLLPKLAQGGMVFLYAPDENWLRSDPWIASAGT